MTGSGERQDESTRTSPPLERRLEYSFLAQVESISLLSLYEGKAILVTHDPRYALTVTHIRPLHGQPPAENRAVFAIHSPAKLFAAPDDAVIGHWFQFDVRRRAIDPDGRMARTLRVTPTDPPP